MDFRPIQLVLQTTQFSLLKTLDLVERCGEHFLDRLNLHVPKNTLELLPILFDVLRGPQPRVFQHSPNSFIDKKLAKTILEDIKLLFLSTLDLRRDR